jgi:hypothetical protein
MIICLHDTKSEKVLDVLTPPCYDTDTDIADFDEFIHVGRRRWDAIGYDTDPIYDTKDHLRNVATYNYHNRFLLTSGNQEMKSLLVAFKTPRMMTMVPRFFR